MPLRKPDIEQVYQFIAHTHQVEKLPCTYIDVINTTKTPNKNWYADGHLRTISTAINKVLPSTDFPSRLPNVTHIYQSEDALHWMRNLHLLMLEPLVRNPKDVLSNATEINQQEVPKISYLGIWRPDSAGNLMGPAPAPQLIPAIMLNWLKQLLNIHNKIKDKVDNPYAIDKPQFREMMSFIDQQPLFFSSVQPFKDANNRFGRLIENVIRIAWRLPFRWNVMEGYDTFKEQLEPYQITNIPQIITQTRETKH